MKPARFDYIRAETLAEAHAALAAEGDDARVIAGGQTLVPMLSMRLARPKVAGRHHASAGACARSTPTATRIRVGAGVRQAELLAWPELARAPAAAGRGAALGRPRADAQPRHRLRLDRACRSERGDAAGAGRARRRRRAVVAPQAAQRSGRRFLHRHDVDRARDDELIEAVRFRAGHARDTAMPSSEFGRRHGDFAIVACAAVASRDGVRLAVGGVADRPVRARLSRARRQRARRCARCLRLGARRARRPACNRALSPRSGPPHGPRHDRGGPPMPRLSADAAPSRPLHAQRPRGRGRGRAAHAADRFPAPRTRRDRHACRLRARRLRRLHHRDRRRAGARLPDARRAGRRRRDPHRRRRWRPSRAGSRCCRRRSAAITRCSAASAPPAS